MTVTVTATEPLYLAISKALGRLTRQEPQHMRGTHHMVAHYVQDMARYHMPHGSGFDKGCWMDWDKSTEHRLVFQLAFHHTDDHGSYCGWTDHRLWVKPIFGGIGVRLDGPNKRDAKDYLVDTLYCSLTNEVETFYPWAVSQGYIPKQG